MAVGATITNVRAYDDKNIVVTVSLTGDVTESRSLVFARGTSTDDINSQVQALINRYSATTANAVTVSTALSSVTFVSSAV